MLKLKRSFFENPHTRKALEKISVSEQIVDAKVSYWAGKLMQKIDSQATVTRGKVLEVLKKHAILNEIGMPKQLEDGSFEFQTEEKAKENQKEFQLIMDEEFEEKFPLMPISTINGLGLSPKEMVAIEAIIDPNL